MLDRARRRQSPQARQGRRLYRPVGGGIFLVYVCALQDPVQDERLLQLDLHPRPPELQYRLALALSHQQGATAPVGSEVQTFSAGGRVSYSFGKLGFCGSGNEATKRARRQEAEPPSGNPGPAGPGGE
eukprot:CAMPEP_0179902870 /NCGR_PEP_ID=MMETSP0982-20121206/40864_1 /TAXON_ID=483367 /ORGANISM="non described non described, Strain CCMP 2436" /LENGTH=127 /DNA_ID=CAMNT_0021802185 /DNA_START=374 /DNA_END=758 /DNA_ORIENTATION=+